MMEEADDDDDDKLSYAEFQNIVSRAPNFAGYIVMRFCNHCYTASISSTYAVGGQMLVNKL